MYLFYNFLRNERVLASGIFLTLFWAEPKEASHSTALRNSSVLHRGSQTRITFGCIYTISEIPYKATINSLLSLTRAFLRSPISCAADSRTAAERQTSECLRCWNKKVVFQHLAPETTAFQKNSTSAVVWKNYNLFTSFTNYK